MGNADVLGFIRKSLVFVRGRAAAARHTALFATLLAASSAYIDPHEGGRHLALTVFYPAAGQPGRR
jgi:hypothetical protein